MIVDAHPHLWGYRELPGASTLVGLRDQVQSVVDPGHLARPDVRAALAAIGPPASPSTWSSTSDNWSAVPRRRGPRRAPRSSSTTWASRGSPPPATPSGAIRTYALEVGS
ncbi:hypothetical protein ACWER9_10910 [Micromonospora sp. NPDC003944]